MFEWNEHQIKDHIGDLGLSMCEAVVRALVGDVKASFARHMDEPARGEDGSRAYDYRSTPGGGQQSFGAWHRAISDTMVGDLRDYRKNPNDMRLAWRLQASLKLYAAAGDAFCDIIVDAKALTRDPLDRLALDEKRSKQSRALRGSDIPAAMQDAVLDAASGDRVRINRAKTVLGQLIQTGTDREVCIAAALLGSIADPFNQAKINKLAEQIEQQRWKAGSSADGGAVPAVPPAAVPVKAEAVVGHRDATRAVEGQVVERGGEEARRLSDPAPSPRGDPRDAASFYDGEDQ